LFPDISFSLWAAEDCSISHQTQPLAYLQQSIGMDPEYSHFYEEVFSEISHASRCYIAIPSGTPSKSQGEKIERMQIVLETQT